MARGPDGKGGGAGFSLADQLFNARTVTQLGTEYAEALPGFDRAGFVAEAVAGLAGRGLLERLDWLADCVQDRLPRDFPVMADALEAAMPPILDIAKTDDDFGQFIHAVPGILAVRHGLDAHRERALDLLHAATQRFSMEFYIRPFLQRWPEETLARLEQWTDDPNYHVRRLVSEGTRPKLPWAAALALPPARTLPLLDRLHADPTRYVTRSVANHLNDLTKSAPDLVLERLSLWREDHRQQQKELAWMTRHALRSMVKSGHPGALAHLGYDRTVPVTVDLTLATDRVRIGDALGFSVALTAQQDLPVLVDYRLRFATPRAVPREKVFKLKTATLRAGERQVLQKSHQLKADATTFRLYPGRHRLTIQVNGVDRAEAEFDVAGPEV